MLEDELTPTIKEIINKSPRNKILFVSHAMIIASLTSVGANKEGYDDGLHRFVKEGLIATKACKES